VVMLFMPLIVQVNFRIADMSRSDGGFC